MHALRERNEAPWDMFVQIQLPRNGGTVTNVDCNGVFTIGREEHNEYINAFHTVILLGFRSNHDVRFLVGAGRVKALYYCLKYVTKVQFEVDSLEGVLFAAYERRKKQEEEKEKSGIPLCVEASGKSRATSMALSMSRRQEISATMCGLYLRRGSAFFFRPTNCATRHWDNS